MGFGLRMAAWCLVGYPSRHAFLRHSVGWPSLDHARWLGRVQKTASRHYHRSTVCRQTMLVPRGGESRAHRREVGHPVRRRRLRDACERGSGTGEQGGGAARHAQAAATVCVPGTVHRTVSHLETRSVHRLHQRARASNTGMGFEVGSRLGFRRLG